MNFERGIDPKKAMSIGLPKCEYCHKVLKGNEYFICNNCLSVYGKQPKYQKNSGILKQMKHINNV